MGSKAMDHSLIRGAVTALLVVGVAPVAKGQVAAGQVRPARDTFFVRTMDVDKAKIDSMMTLMRVLELRPAFSDEALRLRREVELVARALAESRGQAKTTFFFAQPPVARNLRGWIGIEVGLVPQEQGSDNNGMFFVHYFRYPEIISVEPNSPAQRAGIVQGDVLMAYDGQDVVRNRVNLTELLVPDKKLGVTVQREGESKELSLTVARPPQRILIRRGEPGGATMPGLVEERDPFRRGGRRGGFPAALPPDQLSQDRVMVPVPPGVYPLSRVPFFNRVGLFGADLITVTPEFASAVKLERGGVYIQGCLEETPAFKAGLRLGDIIVSVDGRPVNNVADVQAVVMSRLSQGTVGVRVLRDKKPVDVALKW